MKRFIKEFMQSLMDFEAYATQAEFLQIFGQEEGVRLWQEFTGKCASNTTIFYRVLELDEREMFETFLSEKKYSDKAKL